MYHNVHYPVAALAEGVVKAPGLCTIQVFKKEDVLQWPAFDPQTGIIAAAITLRPGKLIYLFDAVTQTNNFTEVQKNSAAGAYFEINVKGTLRGSAAAHQLTLGTMLHHEWGIIAEDKNGASRLIGNEDTGADIIFDYTSGQGNDSRKTEATFKWQHPQPAPIYTATAFQIILGGTIITAGCIVFIKRFRVGDPGAPMNDGDTIFADSGIINKKVLVMADGLGLPVDDFSGDIDWTGSNQRRVEKALASNTISFVGAVINEEIIEIYAYT